MRAILQPDGRLEVPRTAETGQVLGDGSEVIGPDHPDWAAWVRTLAPDEQRKVAQAP